jgi:hypothetical protein
MGNPLDNGENDMSGSAIRHFQWWGIRGRKVRVESCLVLDIFEWKREGLLEAGSRYPLLYRVGNPAPENTSELRVILRELDLSRHFVDLEYSRRRSGTRQRLRYRVPLTSTEPNFGGERWWFLCPLVREGKACARRVAKLYLPPQKLYFGCRQCYCLNYRSSQESHCYDRLVAIYAEQAGKPLAELRPYLREPAFRAALRTLANWLQLERLFRHNLK